MAAAALLLLLELAAAAAPLLQLELASPQVLDLAVAVQVAGTLITSSAGQRAMGRRGRSGASELPTAVGAWRGWRQVGPGAGIADVRYRARLGGNATVVDDDGVPGAAKLILKDLEKIA